MNVWLTQKTRALQMAEQRNMGSTQDKTQEKLFMVYDDGSDGEWTDSI